MKRPMKKRRRFTPENLALRVGRSRTGLGLFTEEAISPRTCIIEYTGRQISPEEEYTSRSKYLFTVGRNHVIDGNTKTNRAKYINHSCIPNCEADVYKKKVYIFSLRPIQPGEELTYHYGKEYFEDYIQPKGCRCFACEKP